MKTRVLPLSLTYCPNSFEKIMINRKKTYLESETKGFYLEFMLLLDLQANQAFSFLFSSSSSPSPLSFSSLFFSNRVGTNGERMLIPSPLF